MRRARGFFCGHLVTGKNGQKILHDHFAALALKQPVNIGQTGGELFENNRRKYFRREESEPPQAGAIKCRLFCRSGFHGRFCLWNFPLLQQTIATTPAAEKPR